MIIGEPNIFEVGDPVIDQYDKDRRVDVVMALEKNSSGQKVLLVEAEGHPGETWRILDADAVLP